MTCEEVNSGYFEWLVHQVCYPGHVNFRKLLGYLHSEEFRWPEKIPMDKNRAEDGLDLRTKFVYSMEVEEPELYLGCINGPCSVLEMMVALSKRCEDDLMCDDTLGNRTSVWFWKMINSLGLSEMNDEAYNELDISYRIANFNNRRYCRNGAGGLFYVPNFSGDMRTIEIWYQLQTWINSFEK